MKKWAIWKTILVVIASVVFVAGATVGGVYLAGGFKTKYINPDRISFVIDEKFFNAEYAQYEISGSDENLTFNAVIEGEKEGDEITQKTVTLDLDGGRIDYEKKTVRNNVVVVPREVTIGEPFTITLNRQPLRISASGEISFNEQDALLYNQQGLPVPWVVGGLTTITARAENEEVYTTVNLAVDTPVYSIHNTAVNNDGREVDQLTINETFDIKTVFYPAESAYLFNDRTNDRVENKRVRRAFYETVTNNIRAEFDEEFNRYFSAVNVSTGNRLNAYAFRDATAQIENINQITNDLAGDLSAIYSRLVSLLNGGQVSVASGSLIVDINRASIKTFSIGYAGSSYNMYAGEDFVLTMTRTPYANATLDAKVISSNNNEELPSMLRNIAINFEYSIDNGQTYQDASRVLDILGGEQVEIEDKTYYLSDTTPKDPRYCFWTLRTNGEYEIRMTVVLLIEVEGQEGVYSLFKDDGTVISSNVTLYTEIKEDEPVKWANDDPINITLDFNGTSTKPASRTLSNLVSIPQNNIYKTPQFFAHFANGTTSEEIEKILGKGNADLSPDNINHNGTYQFGNSEMTLYPVSNELTVYDIGRFELYYATVQTVGNKYVIDDDNRYVIVQPVATPLNVIVTKTLYQDSISGMTHKTSMELEEGLTNYYFHSGSADTIELTFQIVDDSYAIFAEKLGQNRIEFNMLAYNADNELVSINEHFNNLDINSIVYDEEEKTVTYILTIKSTFNEVLSDLRIVSASLKDLDNDALAPWIFDFTENYYLYTPIPETIDFAVKDFQAGDYQQNIEINQTLSNDADANLTIRYEVTDAQTGRKEVREYKSVKEFVEQNINVIIADQHGNTSIFEDDWIFVTDYANIVRILPGGKEFAFSSTEGEQSANIYVRYSGSEKALASDIKLSLTVNSSGIQRIEYDNSTEIGSTADLIASDSLDVISIGKYGSNKIHQGETSANNVIDLYKLVTLYLDASTEYLGKNYNFILDSQYLDAQDSNTIVDMFGENGMLILTFSDASSIPGYIDDIEQYANAIKNVLRTAKIQSMTVNHNFGKNHDMIFKIVDAGNTGVVNITMNFTFFANVATSGSTTLGTTENPIYAATNYSIGSGNGSININYTNADTNVGEVEKSKSVALNDILLKQINKNGTAYVVDNGESGYKIAFGDSNKDISSATITVVGGVPVFSFNDFWNERTLEFPVVFYLEETDNDFAPFVSLNFTITRNIQVVNKKIEDSQENKKYYLIERSSAESSSSQSNNIRDYIDIDRIAPSSVAVPADIRFTMQENPFFSIVNNQANNQATILRDETKFPVFPYGETQLIYNVTVSIGESAIGNADLVFDSGIDYAEIANRMLAVSNDANGDRVEETGKAKVETYKGVNYLKLTEGAWEVDNNSQGAFSGYRVNFIRQYTDKSSNNSIEYTSIEFGRDETDTGNIACSFYGFDNSGLSGLENEENFVTVRVENSDRTWQYVLLMPIIISRVGSTYAVYDNNQEATLTDVLNDNIEQLIEKDKYMTVDAGDENIVVASEYIDINNPFGETAQKDAKIYYFNSNGQTGIILEEIFVEGYSKTGLVKEIDHSQTATNGNVILKLNHLVGGANNFAYVFLKATISGIGNSGGSFTQVYYYVVRVRPDTELISATYPYADGEEHISIDKNGLGQFNSKTIDLDEKFDKTTLAPDSTRYTISVNGQAGVYKDYPVSHYVKSVSEQGRPIENWQDVIGVEFNNENRTMTLRPKQDGVYTIVVTRSYQNVVGGELDYTFIINEVSNYNLEFVDTAITPARDEVNTWIWNVNRNSADGQSQFQTRINLRAGENQTSTIVEGELAINAINYEDACEKIVYNNKNSVQDGVNPYSLLIELQDYLSQDHSIDVYLYTKFGLLGTLRINIKGSVEFTGTQLGEVNAGKDVDLKDFLGQDKNNAENEADKDRGVKINGQKAIYFVGANPADSETPDYYYNIKSAKIIVQEEQKINGETIIVEKELDNVKFAKIENDKLITYSNAEDKEITIKFELNICFKDDKGRLVEKLFTFNHNVKIAKDLKNNDPAESDIDLSGNPNSTRINTVKRAGNVIAGEEIVVTANELFNAGNLQATQNAFFSWRAISGGEAFSAGSSADITLEEQQGKIVIKTNDIAENTNCTALITVSLRGNASEESTEYCSFYVKYEFLVEKNTLIATNYPAPQGQELDVEYISDETIFNDFLTDFVNAQAPFVNTNESVNKPLDADKNTKDYDGNGLFSRFDMKYKVRGENKSIGFAPIEDAKFEVKISSANNVSIRKVVDGQEVDVDSTNKVFSDQDGNNVVFENRDGMTPVGEFGIKLYIGNWREVTSSTGEKYYTAVSDGTQSTVTFMITCNEVVNYYTIVIVEDAYTLAINTVNNNVTDQGEIFYVDNLTKSAKIFEADRMATFTVKRASENGQIGTIIKTPYKMLFESVKDEEVDNKRDSVYAYKYVDLQLSDVNIGQAINVDLGEPFTDYNFVGLYVADKFATEWENYVNSIGSTKPENNPGYAYERFTTSATNYDSQIFSQTPTLISRLDLRYNNIKVDYEKYASTLKVKENDNDEGISAGNYEVQAENIDKYLQISKFSFTYPYKLASSSTTKEVKYEEKPIDIRGVTYSYCISVDVQVDEAIEFVEKTQIVDGQEVKTITANSESTNDIYAYQTQNLIAGLGVRHPSSVSKQLVSADDLKSENIDINLEIMGLNGVWPTNDAYIDAIRNIYDRSGVTNFEPQADRSNSLTTYLEISPVLFEVSTGENTPRDETIDWQIRGSGASNQGNHVILHMNYEVKVTINGEPKTFSKDFYIVMKVLPDYEITYLKVGTATPDNDGNITNAGETTIYTISELTTNPGGGAGENYVNTILASNSNNDNKIVSVVHKNDPSKLEVGAQGFTYTMKINDTDANDETITYNKDLNVKSKLARMITTGNHWSANISNNVQLQPEYKWTSSNDNDSIVIIAKEVKFGVQYYRLTAVDMFGFKFDVCFALSNVSQINPAINFGNDYLLEGDSFDIGTYYNKITLTPQDKIKSGENEDKIPLVSTEEEGRAQSENVSKVMNISNLTAYGYDKPLYAPTPNADGVTPENYGTFFTGTDSNNLNELNSAYVLVDAANKSFYKNIPIFLQLRVTSIKLYYNKKFVGEVVLNNEQKATTFNEKIASSAGIHLFKDAEHDAGFEDAKARYLMPRLPGYIYGSRSDQELEMVVALGYNSSLSHGGSLESGANYEETYDLRTSVTVRRSTNIVDRVNNVVRDGQTFDVKDYMNVSQTTGNKTTMFTANQYAIYDDALAVTTPANSNTEFKLTITKTVTDKNDQGEVTGSHQETVIENRSVFCVNNNSYASTDYLSLSDLAEVTLDKTAKFTITGVTVKGNNESESAIIKYAGNIVNTDVETSLTRLDGKAGKSNADDVINIEDSRKLYNNSVNITKSYLVSVNTTATTGEESENSQYDANAETVEYRYPRTYMVTGFYYSLNYNYTGLNQIVDDYLEVAGADGSISGNNVEYIIPLMGWTKGMELTTAVRTSSGISTAVYDTFSEASTEKLYFEITTTTVGGTQTSGAATIDEDGTIRTNQRFDINSHYITVAIKQKVSGLDGRYANKATDQDFDLTRTRTFSFRLRPKATDADSITLGEISSLIKSEGNEYTLALRHRSYVNGDIKYENRLVNFTASGLGNVKAYITNTTLWAGESATGVNETSNSGTFDGVYIDKPDKGGISFTSRYVRGKTFTSDEVLVKFIKDQTYSNAIVTSTDYENPTLGTYYFDKSEGKAHATGNEGSDDEYEIMSFPAGTLHYEQRILLSSNLNAVGKANTTGLVEFKNEPPKTVQTVLAKTCYKVFEDEEQKLVTYIFRDYTGIYYTILSNFAIVDANSLSQRVES